MTENIKVVSNNRKAGFEYFLLEKFEAGLSLMGTEIKSIRAGQMSIAEAYVDVENGREAWLIDSHIAPYEQGNRYNVNPTRDRKLLLHRQEILRLQGKAQAKGMTIVPLRVYLRGNRAKVELALAKGKRQYDKREAIAQRDAEREMEREAQRAMERER